MMAANRHILKKTHIKNLRHAATVARNSMVLIMLLTIGKAFGSYMTNIVSLAGDAVGSLVDIVAITAIYIGLKLSQRKASSKFTYGFHRIETVASLAISVTIIFLGYRIFLESYTRIFVPAQTTAHSVGIVIAIISICVSLFAFHYHRKEGQRINSKALIASAYDKRNDALVSSGVLFSVVADKFRIPYVEGILGIGIACLILFSGIKYGKEALLYLLDYWDNPEITRKIKQLLQKSPIVTAVKNIRLRHAGTFIFGEAFIEVNPFTDSKDLRDEIHRLDTEIENSIEHLGDLVLYIDPPKPMVIRVALPISDERGLQSHIAENPHERFQFLFIEIKNSKITKYYSRPEKFTFEQVSEIVSFLKNEKTNILISSLIKPLTYYNLRLNNIRIYPHFLDVKDAENTVKLLLLDI